MLMEMSGASCADLAAATGWSRSYVGELRTGARSWAARPFVSRAGDYLGRMLGEPGRVAVALIVEEPEQKAGGNDAD